MKYVRPTRQPHSCFHNSKVNDTRPLGKKQDGIRRRRECLKCGKLFTTREVVVDTILTEEDQMEHKEVLAKITARFKTQFDKFVERVESL